MKLELNQTELSIVEHLNHLRANHRRQYDFIMTCLCDEAFCLMAVQLQQEHGTDAVIEFINSDRWEVNNPIG